MHPSLPPYSRLLGSLITLAILLCAPARSGLAQLGTPTRILFVGNSFTYGFGATAQNYNANTVTDENGMGYGGVPAIFKKFTDEAGLNYEVHLETVGGQSLQYHHDTKLAVIAQPKWDVVVLQGLSTEVCPPSRNGNPANFELYGNRLEQAIHAANPAAKIYLYATWTRSDLTDLPTGPYFGSPAEAMGNDIYDEYSHLAETNGRFAGVNPVGAAWKRAMHENVFQRNHFVPEPGRIDPWTVDGYHGSNAGYYLSALVHFEAITGRDARTLAAAESSLTGAATFLGILPADAQALQRIAHDTVTTGRRLPAFLNGAVSLSTTQYKTNGVYSLTFPATGNLFGFFTPAFLPHYLYHFDLGFEYLFETNDGSNGVYLYDFASQGFFYTSPTFPFPYLYDFSRQAVLYYYPDPNDPGHYTSNPRTFYDFNAGQIIQK